MNIVDLIKYYDGKTVVNSVSFEIPKGKVLSLIGPNGAGKSTVMGMISRLIAKDSGVIDFQEKDLSQWNSKELAKKLSILTQHNNIQMKLTVRELVAFGRFPYSGNHLTAADHEMIDTAIAYMELQDIEDRFIDELSGGQRQRVMIAMALSCNPKILIADEPTTALDVTMQAQILDIMNKLKKTYDTAIILITHDLGVVAQMADRIAVMYAGEIMEAGDARQIFYQPSHPYTWGLLGAMPNMIQDVKSELYTIPGTPPDLYAPPVGCPFAARCEYAMEACLKEEPPKFVKDSGHMSRCWLHDERAPEVTPPAGIPALKKGVKVDE